jgi:phospholipid-binding lipoprotein MlaA
MKNHKTLRGAFHGGCAALALGLGVVSAPLAVAQDLKPAEAAVEDVNDPIEPFNRGVFWVNELLQTWFIRPMAIAYKSFLPPGMQASIGNFLFNLAEPVTLANDLLQGEMERAGTTVQRFAINSTYGIAGLFDRATEMGYGRHDEDFGQTLAVWGVGEGFYLVLPLFGPSNPRDGVGMGADMFIDPWGYVLTTDLSNTRMVLGGTDEYAGVTDELDQIRKTSVDYYAALRSLYRQKRAAEIRNGEGVDLPPIPDLTVEVPRKPAKAAEDQSAAR